MSLKQSTESVINETIFKEIRNALAGLAYGTVAITVHNRKITQIEVSHKKRFDDIWKIEGGGGI